MKHYSFAAAVALASVFAGCSKNAALRDMNKKNTNSTTTTISPTTSSATTVVATTAPATATALQTFSLNWNSRSNGAYGIAGATADFGNVVYWNAFNTQVLNGTLCATLGKGQIGPSGGAMSRINVTDAAAYELQFDMKFDNLFDFSAGGKVGFGLLIGAGYTGGTPGWDGNGGSARIMWFKNSAGRVYLKPYIYHRDQQTNYGDDFGKSYPATGSLQKGVWHTVKIYAKSNTGSNTDGRIRVVINGVTLLDQPIRWTTNDLQRLVNNICFENFRGGAESYWQSASDGNIYFNNIKWSAF